MNVEEGNYGMKSDSFHLPAMTRFPKGHYVLIRDDGPSVVVHRLIVRFRHLLKRSL